MRTAFTRGMAMVAGLLAATSATAEAKQKQPVSEEDSRSVRVRQFFQRCGCPAQKWAAEFIAAADKYRLDWRLLPTLAFVESGGGRAARNHNLFGWNNGAHPFRSPQESIHYVAQRLSQSKVYKHKPLEQVLYLFNPKLPFVARVLRIMDSVGPASLSEPALVGD